MKSFTAFGCLAWSGTVVGLVVLVATGCRTAERAMLGISRIKSPVTIATPGLNQPFTRQELLQAGISPDTFTPVTTPVSSPNADGPRHDDFADLKQKETTVLVCLSGGGARAARMATHTLALLEQQYNRRSTDVGSPTPLVRRIDGWSSISGGSVYASFVAARLSQPGGGGTNTFSDLVDQWRPRWGTQQLGGAALVYYFWPGNLGYAPAMQLSTEWATLHLFARNLAVLHEPEMRWFPMTRMRQLGELPVQPRFFFNTTCRETARPLILTQSVLHRNLSGDPLARLAEDPLKRWIANEPASAVELAEPFRHAATLEDLGSPPNRFPLAYAAMASAAFPGVFEPVSLRHYFGATNGTAHGAGGNWWWRQSDVSVVDGGIYDNTGLITALQLFDYLRHTQTRTKQKFVILAVDANNEPEGYTGPNPPSRTPWKLDLPFRGALSAVTTVAGMYNSQQALVMAAINQRIRTLEQAGVLEYYPVRLRDAALLPQLTDTPSPTPVRKLSDQAKAEAKSTIQAVNLFGVIQEIPTDFVLTDEEDRELRLTVERLLHNAPDRKPSVAEGFLRALGR